MKHRDLDRGRGYLPQDDLRPFDVDLDRRLVAPEWWAFMAYEIERNRALYSFADTGITICRHAQRAASGPLVSSMRGCSMRSRPLATTSSPDALGHSNNQNNHSLKTGSEPVTVQCASRNRAAPMTAPAATSRYLKSIVSAFAASYERDGQRLVHAGDRRWTRSVTSTRR
jgi:Squalene/phytoene synthase